MEVLTGLEPARHRPRTEPAGGAPAGTFSSSRSWQRFFWMGVRTAAAGVHMYRARAAAWREMVKPARM